MKLQEINIPKALSEAQLPLDFVLPGLLPQTFGLLVAAGATGKSRLALDIAVSIALGRQVAGGLFQTVRSGKVVYLAGEESEQLVVDRLRPLLSAEERNNPLLWKNLSIIPRCGQSCVLLSKDKPTELFEQLLEKCQGARLIVLDPIRRLHTGDENDSAHMTSFVVLMERLAKAIEASVLGLHHTNRSAITEAASQNASRGSSALVDGARWQVNLARMDEKTAQKHNIPDDERPQYVSVDFVKTNYLPSRPKSWVRMNKGGVFQVCTLPTASSHTKLVAGARLI